MNTVVNVDKVEPQRVAGYATNYIGKGWLERTNGAPVRGTRIRTMVLLTGEQARKIRDWIIENGGNPYPFSFEPQDIIVGVEVENQLAPV
jgi:hypothetical protein